MGIRGFMIQEAICCLKEAADNLKRPPMYMLNELNAIEIVIEKLREELFKEK